MLRLHRKIAVKKKLLPKAVVKKLTRAIKEKIINRPATIIAVPHVQPVPFI